VSDLPEPIAQRRPPRPLARDLALGSAAGLLIGLLAMFFHMMLRGWALHEVPLGSYLVIWLAVGLVVGYYRRRAAAPMPEDPSEEDRERRRRTRPRFVAVAFAIGLALGFVATSIDLAWQGWFILPDRLVLNLLLFPYFGVLVSFNLSRGAGEPMWSWRFMRFKSVRPHRRGRGERGSPGGEECPGSYDSGRLLLQARREIREGPARALAARRRGSAQTVGGTDPLSTALSQLATFVQ